jgi:PAS domain S-box-containing protein
MTWLCAIHALRQPDCTDEHGIGDKRMMNDTSHTERKRIEEALSEERRLLKSVTDNASVSLFIMDDHQHCTFMNPAAEQLTGFSFEDVRGRALHDVIHHTRPDGSHYPLSECPIDQALPEDNQMQGEEVFVHRDGHFYNVAFTASPIRDQTGTAVGTIIEVQDITERKRAAEERESLLQSERATRSAAEAAGRMKDEFLATLSHELRTPLNAILGYARLMLMAKMGEDEAKEAARAIERNARVQAQLIEDLLDMNRIISGKIRLDMQRLNVPDAIEEAVKTVRPSAEAKGVRLEVLLDTLAVPVRGDPGRIQQVVWNLLSNAIKFTPRDGKVQVLLERVNSHVEIIVTDTGAGIQPDFVPYVFDRFRQADGSATRRHSGLGLGLAIVKQLVELHGGTIRASSPGEDKGATLTVSIPILAVLATDDADDTERQHPKTRKAEVNFDGCTVDLSGVRVLVVDDEPDATRLVKQVLEECRAEVAEATSAQQALDQLSKGQFDVLVSDIGMPGEDGYQLIRKVRASENGNRNILAIAMTAFARSEDRRRAAMAGFQTHLSKPVEAAELLAIVANLAGKTGQNAVARENCDV